MVTCFKKDEYREKTFLWANTHSLKDKTARFIINSMDKIDRHFTLIKEEHPRREKRVFPLFPYSFLTFKSSSACSCGELTFEVSEISTSGMQLSLHNGTHQLKTKDKLVGTLHSKDTEIKLNAQVCWSSENKIGLTFPKNDEMYAHLKNFLDPKNIACRPKPLHILCENKLGVELPPNLKFWLQTDCLLEIFVWQHSNNELSHFQIIYLKNFVEWRDGVGIKTGKTISKREIETPLSKESELTLDIDDDCDVRAIAEAQTIASLIPEKYLPAEVIKFITIKLGS
ncbi:MAG: PilZ domain-containing protein [Oligoflexia bacterium]|nr:PilZ domain-containing protein [Oligoflexia bacterium]